MEDKLKEIYFLALDAHRNNESMNQILNIVKNSFEAENVSITPSSIVHRSNSKTVYLPIHGKNVNYMLNIVNPKKNISKNDVEEMLKLFRKVMSNVENEKRIVERFQMDDSTSLYNRNAFIDYKKNFHKDKLKSLGCVYIDVDGLHSINNTYGHDAGDLLILTISERLQKVFKDSKKFRIGGDEFVVMIPNMKERNIIEDLYYLNSLLVEDDIFVSMGFSYQEGLIDIEKLVNDADVMMLQNKMQSRKRRR